MHVVDWTVEFGAETADVRVEAAASTELADVRVALAGTVGASPTAVLSCGPDVLRDDLPLTDPRLHTGARLRFGAPVHRVGRAAVLSLQVVGGPAAGRVLPLERGRLTIGRAAANDLSLPDLSVSRRHAEIEVTATSISLRDQDSSNGTWVGGERISTAGAALHVGDIVRVGDSLLRIAGPAGPSADVHGTPDGSLAFRRSPRRDPPAPQQVFDLPAAERTVRPRGVQWLPALLPATAGALIAWMYHQPLFLLFALLSPAMVVSTALSDRWHWRRSRRRAATNLRRRRAEIEQRLAAELSAEATWRRRAAPDAAAVRCAAGALGAQLWTRRATDADLLQVRLGSAELAASVAVRNADEVTSAGRLPDVPYCVDLAAGPLGIAGPPAVVTASARWLLGQLAALCAPGDVEFALLLEPERVPLWRWVRWLPHLRGRIATDAPSLAALVEQLATVVEQRAAAQRDSNTPWRGPWIVVLIDRCRADELTGLVTALTSGAAVGVTGVWVERDTTTLPACCTAVARVSGVTGTRVSVGRGAAEVSAVVLDQVSAEWADELARNLAPLIDAGAADDAAVPTHCTLLDLLEFPHPTPSAIAGSWRRAIGAARTTIGSGVGGRVDIDLARDGPHALVVGTTGAGKSELLRTVVVGLAVHQPPDDLNLLLIDYKGGAAFAECAALPHTAGLVTDLDGYLTERALRSLHAELRRRERLLASVGADDLTGYRSSGAAIAIPRLVIVVDEFATLAAELPEFLPGLIGVAQRGRSLGVHLLLATQRPSAASTDIRANTALRIALRVTDPSESQELLGSPVAAAIDAHRPGRGYLLAGGLTEFQAAHAAAATRSPANAVEVQQLDDWRRPGRHHPDAAQASDLARLVEAARTAAVDDRRPTASCPWPPPLPNTLRRAELQPRRQPLAVPLGRIDLPDEQRQEDLVFDLDGDGSLLAAGRTRSGRTTTLSLVALGAAARLSPEQLHVHVIDPRGGLAAALRSVPHAGTVLGPAELELAPRLLTRLDRVVADRLAGTSGRRAPPALLLLLVDGWDTLCARLPDAVAASCAGLLNGLLRSASAARVSIVVSGEPTLAATRLAASFGQRLLLGRPDHTVLGRPALPGTDLPFPPGRAVRDSDGALVQLVLPDPGAEVAGLAAAWPAGRGCPTAIRIRPLPERLPLSAIPEQPGLTLGVAGDEPTPVSFDPFAGAGRCLVAGPPRSGRSTVLRLLIGQARERDIAMLVAAPDSSPTAAHARARGVPVLGPHAAPPVTPTMRTLVLMDDSDAFIDTAVGDLLTAWSRDPESRVAVVAVARADDLATSYRGVAAEVRRHRCGLLLRPGPLDGELLGVRSAHRGPGVALPGRGLAVADASWGPEFALGEPVPIQLATPDAVSPCADSDDRSPDRTSP